MYLILYRWCCIGNEKKKTPQNLFKMNIVIRFYMILLILYFIVLNPFLYSTYIAPETIKKSFYFFKILGILNNQINLTDYFAICNVQTNKHPFFLSTYQNHTRSF